MRSFYQLIPVAVAFKALLLLGNFGHKLSISLVPGVQTAPSIRTTANQGCIDTVHITLDSNCQFVLTPKLVLEGSEACLSADDYEIFVDDENPLNRDTVDGCGNFRFVVNIKNPKSCTSFTSCWGVVAAEDKMAPVVTAPADTTLFIFCDEITDIYQNLSSTDSFGIATLKDNCNQGLLKIRSFIDAIYYDNHCDTIIIRRLFFASDAKGNQDTDPQFITLLRAPLASIQLPDSVGINTCTGNNNPKKDKNGNIHPDVSGYPYVVNYQGKIDYITVDSSCGLSSAYVDTRFEVCPTTYKVLRRWIIKDWCKKISIELSQIIKVGDVDKPIIKSLYHHDFLSTSTSPFDCTAAIEVMPPIVTDACSGYTWTAEIWTDTCRDTLGLPIDPKPPVRLGFTNSGAPKRYIGNLPAGCHLLIYTVRDACHNEAKDTIRLEVQDRISPVAICDDKINITLNEAGYAQLRAEDVDEGSKDNCTLAKLHIRRPITQDENCNPLDTPRVSRWDSILTFTCCDLALGYVKVELRATDAAGNTDYCWTTVWIEDKMKPWCRAPKDTTVYCDSLPKGVDFKNRSTILRYFGAPKVGDNCFKAEWIEFDPEVKINNCGVGTVKRKFLARDESGNESPDTCVQWITVIATHEYMIKFPKDYIEYCKDPSPDTIGTFELACDILAVNVSDKRYQADGEECYKIFRTYNVINWCEYVDGDDVIPVPRDIDCDGTGGEEDVWVIVRHDGSAYFDADNNEKNKFPLKNSRACGGNPEGYWEKLNRKPTGQWTYTQVIKVVDNEAPQVFTESNVSFCINRSDCKADIVLSVGIQEACDPNNLNIETDLKLEINESSSSSQTNWRVFGRYPKYLFTGVVPKGDYQLEIKVTDACGNSGKGFVKFKVVDCKPPSVTCIHGLSAELSELPPNTDIDGDGDVDRASTIVWAKELLASPSIDSCSGPVRYSINRKGEKANINQDYIILTCDDLGLTEVELHAWDNAINTKLSPPGPNHDYCLTYIKVQDNKYNLCKDPGDTLIIEGNTRTELGLSLSGVVVESSGAKSLKAVSVQTGDYLMQGFAAGYDYTLTADKEDDATNGVSTFDVLLITKHILGKQLLSSPYQLLAADVNQSGSISTLDLIKIRRVILHLDTTFEGGKSWIFVDAKHRFKDPRNPWAEAIPKYIQFNDLDRSVSDARFIGIKLGDVNGNVETNGLTQLNPDIIKKEGELLPTRPQLDFKVLSVQPNPFRDQVQIKWSSPSGGEATLQVIDAFGRTVRQDRVDLFVGENNFAYAQQDLPGAGTYSVIIRQNGQQVVTRLVMVN
ncbi:MAG: dockerin type I domain-containing protein [Haliscomenobacter sp.]|uniref:dockerin type I domain-containing protein n=1 Tax=Haliscomenobacter sp. TaxID=2717303 RepID=UPI0029BE432C|nr:dockerin type I domain-containing protein [Haliscomenobacter sp.]MDX2067659.1 dockerin type I domain-containing protein [Haliscomenobacter sp.]